MNEISIAELIELLQNESASIDTQFQLWITITTAVVIASFAARDTLTLWMKTFIAVIYLLASSIIALRYANDASQFLLLFNELKSRGVDYPTVIDLRTLRGLVYVCGTLATLTIIFFRPQVKIGNSQSDKTPEHTDSEQ